MTETDNRIKIINNDKNYGLLFSRAMGILKSSGEYLMNLDADDELKGYNSLKYLYYKAIRYNIDIITFSFKDIKENKNINTCNNLNIIQKQPQLLKSIFGSTNEIKDYFIWNKIIKKETFQKAYEVLKKEIYSLKWNYFEDDIWNILVNRFAKTKLCITRVIYIYNYNKDSLMNKRYGIIEFENLLFRHETYKKIFETKEDEKYLIAEYFFLLNRLNSQKNYILLIKNRNITSKIVNIFKSFLSKFKCTDSERDNIIKLINFINLI